MLFTFNGIAAHAPAIHWAAADFEVSGVELVRNSSWATTYRLIGRDETRYLKILPQQARDRVARIAGISQLLKGKAPTVIRATQDEGWVLFAEIKGREVSRHEDYSEMVAVARSFGSIQAKASRSEQFLAGLETVDVAAKRPALLAFLQRPTTASSKLQPAVGAAYFIGKAEANRYLRLLSDRLHLLDGPLAAAAGLPLTLCHFDLHDQNVLIRDDGKPVFFDWDDATAGPAGLCLHGLFGGCSVPAVLADRMLKGAKAGTSPEAQRLKAYVDALVKGGYESRSTLLTGLIGSMAAGQMRFIISFAKFPGEQHLSDVAETIRLRLSDLLDLCDWLASKRAGTARASADDYENKGEWRRASRLVQHLLTHEPQQVELLTRYANLCYRLGDTTKAEEAARAAFALAPQQLDVKLALAQACMGNLDLDTSARLLTEVIATPPASRSAKAKRSAPVLGTVAKAKTRARTLQNRLLTLKQVQDHAARPEGLGRLALSNAERDSGQLEPDSLALVLALFKQQGAVQIDNVFAPELIARLQKAFSALYGHHYYEGDHPDALQVGNKRYMLTMELDQTFGAEELVASTLMLPVMQGILGSECILSAYTAVISLPGSGPQEVHKDHSPLFEEEDWQLPHPSFAAQMVVPLLTMDELTGATRVFKGTQRTPLKRSADGPYQDPVVPLGSCFLVDYAVAHCGMGNRSNLVRPILNLVYSRPWFRDFHNYREQPPLRFSDAYLESAPDSVADLVEWWDLERKAAANA